MGYRSEVGFACTPQIHEVIKSIAEINKEFKEFLGYADDCTTATAGKYRWEDIKYYDGYPDVDCLNNIMDFLDNVGLDSEYGMIRIGEELEDIESKGMPYEFDMYVNRSIEI